jgi:predicted TPR repeat methyltransferase
MFAGVKNLFNEIWNALRQIDFKNLFKNTVQNAKNSISNIKNKIENLFQTNLENGLNHYYSGHYIDAKMRFILMKKMWNKNPLVYYNLGRCYLALKNDTKAKENLEKALTLTESDQEKSSIKYFLKKANKDLNIEKIPISFKKEFYFYSLQSEINHYLIHVNELKETFNVYNKYLENIFSKENQSLLEIGCGVGLFGKFHREAYQKIRIDGTHISEKVIEFCANLKTEVNNNEVKIYNNLICSETEAFLVENLKSLDDDKALESNSILYNAITAIGSLDDLGQIDNIINLCLKNLQQSGILVFTLPGSGLDGSAISFKEDYFFYNTRKIAENLKQSGYNLLDFFEKSVAFESNVQGIFIIRKD